MHATLNQSSSNYIKVSQGQCDVGVNIPKFSKIDELPVGLGFRCNKCNFGDLSISELLPRHLKFLGNCCSGNRDNFEESHIQIARIGSKIIGFGVIFP